MMTSLWQTAPTKLALSAHDLHLWRIHIDVDESVLKHLKSYLSIDELERAARFRFPIHQKRFIVARGALRQILSSYLKLDPQSLQFSYQEHGKPYLADYNIHFNLSHSAAIAVCVVTRQGEVGVDIEQCETIYQAGIAERFFSRTEFQVLQTLPFNQRAQGFYQIWAKKEALVKAWGIGILAALQDFSVSVTHITDSINRPGRVNECWQVTSFSAAEDYQAAYALQQTPHKVYYWEGLING